MSPTVTSGSFPSASSGVSSELDVYTSFQMPLSRLSSCTRLAQVRYESIVHRKDCRVLVTQQSFPARLSAQASNLRAIMLQGFS